MLYHSFPRMQRSERLSSRGVDDPPHALVPPRPPAQRHLAGPSPPARRWAEESRAGVEDSFSLFPAELEDIIAAVRKAKMRLKANVNFDLAIELLYLTIRENR